jgi:hypothetical protein
VLPGGALFFRLQGSPGAPFALGFSQSAYSGPFTIGNGLILDIGNVAVGFSDIVFLANGYAYPFYVLGPDGTATLNFWLPPGLASGSLGGFQAAIGAPPSLALTAAFYVTVL